MRAGELRSRRAVDWRYLRAPPWRGASKRELVLVVRAALVRAQLELERPRGRTGGVVLDELLDALLGFVERLREPAREPHALFVAGERILERERSAFELLDDHLEARERLLEAERRRVCGGR